MRLCKDSVTPRSYLEGEYVVLARLDWGFLRDADAAHGLDGGYCDFAEDMSCHTARGRAVWDQETVTEDVLAVTASVRLDVLDGVDRDEAQHRGGFLQDADHTGGAESVEHEVADVFDALLGLLVQLLQGGVVLVGVYELRAGVVVDEALFAELAEEDLGDGACEHCAGVWVLQHDL